MIELPEPVGPYPFWFWNSALTPAEVVRQLRAMKEQRVTGVFVHCRSGMRPRYLSDDWWALIEVAATEASRLGMALNFVDEFNWPSGEARDLDVRGAPSRVLAVAPTTRMESLVARPIDHTPYVAHDFAATATLVGVRRASDGAVTEVRSLAEDLQRLRADGGSVSRTDLRGDAVVAYDRTASVGFDGGTVDLLNPDAVEAFVAATHAEYVRRLADHVGHTVNAFFIDHEGDYGYRIAWTPDLAEQFAASTGRRLDETLPMLTEESVAGRRARFDYIDVISSLYAERFFATISRFAEGHGMWVTGHTWEESLHMQAAYLGNPFDFQRALSKPGIDTLFEWARSPRHFVEAASVARISGRPLVVEAQGVQGVESYLSPGRARELSALATVWGATVLIPHAFNSNPDRIDFPEDWFESQPWWPLFGRYADYAGELSRCNQFGDPVGTVAVYYPAETTWANGAPIFDALRWNYFMTDFDPNSGPILRWGNRVDDLDDLYSATVEWGATAHRRIDSIDFRYLIDAEIDGSHLVVGRAAFRVIVLMPMDVIHIDAARRLGRFVEAGGHVLGLRELPTLAVGADGADGELAAIWDRAVTCSGGSLELLDTLDALTERLTELEPPELTVESAAGHPVDDVALTHRVDGDQHLVLLATRSGRGGDFELGGDFSGAWSWRSLEDGAMNAVTFVDGRVGSAVVVRVRPGEALLLLGDTAGAATAMSSPDSGTTPVRLRDSGDHAEIDVTDWERSPMPAQVPICYGRRSDVDDSVFAVREPDPPVEDLNDTWLSAEEHTLRSWQLLGPFPYAFHDEYFTTDDWSAVIGQGRVRRQGVERAWIGYHSADREVDLDRAFGTEDQRGSGPRWVCAYASTTIVSDRDREDVFLRIVAESNARIWLNGALLFAERDDHQGYLELRDAYGSAVPLPLRQGSNQVLVKVAQAARYGGMFGFVARLSDAGGLPIIGLVPSAARSSDHLLSFDVPAGSRHLALKASGEYRVRVGDRVYLCSGPSSLRLREDDGEQTITCAFVEGAQLLNWPVVDVGRSTGSLTSLTETALRFHAGAVAYRGTIELRERPDDGALLRLGEVGTTAEVTVNGIDVGARAWAPYEFEVSSALRIGVNEITVLVRNTRASERARGPAQTLLWGVPCRGPQLLPLLRPNGLEGPVRLVIGTARSS